MRPAERLPRVQERVVLECVAQLLIEQGICFEHEGLLVFPSLFRPTEKNEDAIFEHRVSLYYDFSGAVENIYASLIAWIVLGERFGAVRMWEDRADFETAGGGVCGIRKMDRGDGFAHLDVYFDSRTDSATRELFVSFVEDHLHRHDMDVVEHIEVRCPNCQYDVPDEVIRRRIARGEVHVLCPDCEAHVMLTEGARRARTRNPELHNRTIALRTVVEENVKRTAALAKQEFIRPDSERSVAEPLRILHLSDLHFSATTDVQAALHPLVADITSKEGGLGFRSLDYLVVSGDLVSSGAPEEFEVARKFVTEIIRAFRLTAQRCIIVPGNHDLSWNEDVYEWRSKRRVNLAELSEGAFRKEGDGYLVRVDDEYHKRFRNFSENFFHPLTQLPYPSVFEDQAIPYTFAESRIQFFALNSCWKIDEWFPSRSAIHSGAVPRCVAKGEDQLKRESVEGSVFRIAVWHHPLLGGEAIADSSFLEQLRQANVRLVLHGHVHEQQAELLGYQHRNSTHVVAAGAFGAPANARPESTPRLYNLLELARDHSSLRVHTRAMRKSGGAWSGWPEWPGECPNERRTFYEIQF
jgi:predicted phosphodiesterase